ncbi:NADH-quinone oxidoreductase subunit NuoG [Parvularcula dongshanensis]|uniref:NADH-quinone oxidoreductase n=1 Tax=Parvularcula dongshanensis TaxID=1173995 RepID=A0A840I0G3_9PROT|nr:NADH-quinone oxidoreductase subunit NuoG [Parvularcula dongshanensis]MBB4658556.1 NADH-quinone oxidoreductase subunit G [Parvularcula dongshanensis]
MSDTAKPAPATRTIKVNGHEVEVDPALTLLQACEAAGEEIPRFCYHERLSVAGNCRMCLIEVKGGPPKPVASCAQNVKDLRPGPDGAPPELFTNTPMVKKAREGVMEFLLINHPLDCPVCDQGGECDLQDQAMAYGRGGTRFEENKRAVEEKYMGPLIKTIMTRCIQCTRCVRFATEVAGVNDLGLVNRGENAEITTYLEKAVDTELSGNLIDICPVGALTSKPYAFMARPWELRKTESIDVMDAMGSNIRIDARGREVLRILPRVHDGVNEEWLADKSRFIWDGLRKRRLDKPFIREGGKLRAATWDEAFEVVRARLEATPKEKVGALVGDLVPAEAVMALKDLTDKIGTPHRDCRQDGSSVGVLPNGERAPRGAYLMGSTIAGIDEADAILLIGTNPRHEAPLLNARIRRNWLNKMGLKVGLIGQATDLTYDYEHLGAGTDSLTALHEGKIGFLDVLKDAKRPLVLIGSGALVRGDAHGVMSAALKLAEAVGATGTDGWNGFGVLQTAAARAGALDLGFLPSAGGRDFAGILDGARSGEIEVVYNLGADECDVEALRDAFVIYQGSHGDRGASVADVVFPAASYAEQSGLYVNLEGRVQQAIRAYFPFGEAREDWAIIRALSGRLGEALPYDDLFALRQRMIEENEVFATLDLAEPGAAPSASLFDGAGALSGDGFSLPIGDYYLTNPIARASAIMAECSTTFAKPKALAAE